MRDTKYCRDCNTIKPLHKFSAHNKNRDGRQNKCKACFRIYQMAHRYGLPLQSYKAMVEHHQGKCGICDKERPLVIDHNHDTGKVRGLLCQPCNTALGLFGDSVETLRAAEGYLIHD